MTSPGSDIIERLEKATGPDRELDCEIMALLYTKRARHIGAEENSGPGGEWVAVATCVWVDPGTDQWVSTDAKIFTSSLDEALALVPEGLQFTIRSKGRHGSPSSAVVGVENWNGATPAIALCIAALRARAAQDSAS